MEDGCTTLRRRFSQLAASAVFALTLSGCKSRTTLDTVVQNVDIVESNVDNVPGGVSMAEAVWLLRYALKLPVSFEEIPYTKSSPKLSLAQALSRLEELKKTRGLRDADRKRLDIYKHETEVLESLAKLRQKITLAPQEEDYIKRYERFYGKDETADKRLVGFDKKTFRIQAKNITIEAFLNRLTTLDTDYVWTNSGTRERPVVSIRPKGKSTLDWTNGEFCTASAPAGSSPEKFPRSRPDSIRKLFDKGGELEKLFGGHGIQIYAGQIRRSLQGGPEQPTKIPAVKFGTCNGSGAETGAALLSRAVTQAGAKYFWTVQTIGEHQVLYFDSL